MCRSRVALSRCFVRQSAGLRSPAILVKVDSFARSLSWTHRSDVAKWRILPRPFLFANPYGRRGVRLDVQLPLQAQVSRDGQKSQTL